MTHPFSPPRQCYRWQAGCLRINCLDCLDRTNLCQTVVGLKVLDAMLTSLWKSTELRDSKIEQFRRVFAVRGDEGQGEEGSPKMLTSTLNPPQEMWAKNGDNLSRCVTGTGAISGGVKVTLLKDMQRSVVRTIKNNFMDNRRQVAIDILLGKFRDGVGRVESGVEREEGRERGTSGAGRRWNPERNVCDSTYVSVPLQPAPTSFESPMKSCAKCWMRLVVEGGERGDNSNPYSPKGHGQPQVRV